MTTKSTNKKGIVLVKKKLPPDETLFSNQTYAL